LYHFCVFVFISSFIALAPHSPVSRFLLLAPDRFLSATSRCEMLNWLPGFGGGVRGTLYFGAVSAFY
jgi:hypothetical protein